MASKRKRRTKRVEYDTYVVPIQSWDWDYSFGIHQARYRPDDAYDDYRHLIVRGLFDRPKSIVGHKVELIFCRERTCESRWRRDGSGLLTSGTFSKNRSLDVMQGLLSMQEDVLPALLPMLIADRHRYVVLHGERLKRGSASILSYRFQSALTEDDLPPND